MRNYNIRRSVLAVVTLLLSTDRDARSNAQVQRTGLSVEDEKAIRATPAVVAVGINWQLARDRPGRMGSQRGS